MEGEEEVFIKNDLVDNQLDNVGLPGDGDESKLERKATMIHIQF